MKRILASVFLCLLLATPAGAGFDEGVAAYKRGDYTTALREFRPIAEQGDAPAQYTLGVRYDKLLNIVGEQKLRGLVDHVRKYGSAGLPAVSLLALGLGQELPEEGDAPL
jgi:TPR repeat protein